MKKAQLTCHAIRTVDYNIYISRFHMQHSQPKQHLRDYTRMESIWKSLQSSARITAREL